MISGLKLVGKSLITFIVWLWVHTIVWAWKKVDLHRVSIEMNSYNVTLNIFAHDEVYTIQHRFSDTHLIGLRWTTQNRGREYEFESYIYRYWNGWLPFELRTAFNKSWRCKECSCLRDYPVPAHETCRRCLDKFAAQAAAELKAKEDALAKGEAVPEYVETVW